MTATGKKSGLNSVVAANYINRVIKKISPELIASKMSIDPREVARIELGLETSRSKISSYITAVEEIQSGKFTADKDIKVTDRFCDLMLEFPEYSPARGRILALITTTMANAHRGSLLSGKPSRRLTLSMLRQGVLDSSEIKDEDIKAIITSTMQKEFISAAKTLGQFDLVTMVTEGVIYLQDTIPSTKNDNQITMFSEEEVANNPRRIVTPTAVTPVKVSTPAPAPAPAPAPVVVSVPEPAPAPSTIKLSKTEIVTHDPSMSISDLLKDAESAVIEVSRFRGPNGKVLYVIEVAT